MGRPPKPPEELQDDILSVRLNAKASRRFAELARRSGRRRSDVIRSLIAEGSIRQTVVPEANLEVLLELRRIGGHLNQIAKKLHVGRHVDVGEVHAACQQLARVFTGLENRGTWTQSSVGHPGLPADLRADPQTGIRSRSGVSGDS